MTTTPRPLAFATEAECRAFLAVKAVVDKLAGNLTHEERLTALRAVYLNSLAAAKENQDERR